MKLFALRNDAVCEYVPYGCNTLVPLITLRIEHKLRAMGYGEDLDYLGGEGPDAAGEIHGLLFERAEMVWKKKEQLTEKGASFPPTTYLLKLLVPSLAKNPALFCHLR